MSTLHIRNNRRFNIYASGTIDGVRYPSFRDPALWSLLGITELEEPAPPKDYNAEVYRRVETDEAPYVAYVLRPTDEVKFNRREQLEVFIQQTEASTLLARPVRDFMIALAEDLAAKAGVPKEQLALVNPGYAKVKALDDEITAARNEIRDITVEIGPKPDLLGGVL